MIYITQICELDPPRDLWIGFKRKIEKNHKSKYIMKLPFIFSIVMFLSHVRFTVPYWSPHRQIYFIFKLFSLHTCIFNVTAINTTFYLGFNHVANLRVSTLYLSKGTVIDRFPVICAHAIICACRLYYCSCLWPGKWLNYPYFIYLILR